MKLSELIQRLEDIKAQRGDLDAWLESHPEMGPVDGACVASSFAGAVAVLLRGDGYQAKLVE